MNTIQKWKRVMSFSENAEDLAGNKQNSFISEGPTGMN